MQSSSNFVLLYFGFSALLGIYISLLTAFQKKGNRKANIFLSGFIFSLSYFLIIKVLAQSKVIINFPHLMGTALPVWFLSGPLFYFYIRFLIDPNYKIKFWESLHIVPSLSYVFAFRNFFFRTAESKLAYFKNIPAYLIDLNRVFNYLPFVSIILYFVLCLFLLEKHQSLFKSFSSDTEIENTNWLKSLILVFSLYFFFDIIGSIFLIISNAQSSYLHLFTFFMMTVFIHLVSYSSFKHPERIFFSIKTKVNGKYKTSNMTNKEISINLENLKIFIEKEKPYLNSKISLPELADKIGLTTHQLSQIINQEVKLNFYDFINSYRIKEAQKMIGNPNFNSFSIYGIALEVGFNNKSTFNKNFKKFTNLTPSEYKKSLNK